MLDPEDPLWDEYGRVCELHKQMIAVEERTGRSHPDAYGTALECYNLMRKCLCPAMEAERLDPELEDVLEYLKANPFSSQQELHEDAGIRSDKLKVAIEKANGQIAMDVIEGTVRYWINEDPVPISAEEVDRKVVQYLEKCRKTKVLTASRHLNLPEYRVRKSLNNQGFPRGQELNEFCHTVTAYYAHGTKVKEKARVGSINDHMFANSTRKR